MQIGPKKMQRMLRAIFRVGILCPQTEAGIDFCAEETTILVLFFNVKNGS